MTSLLDKYIEDLCEKHGKDFSRVAHELLRITGAEDLSLNPSMIETRYWQLKRMNPPDPFLMKYISLAKLPSSLTGDSDDCEVEPLVIPEKFRDLSSVRFDDIIRDDRWVPSPTKKPVDPYSRSLEGRKTDRKTSSIVSDSEEETEPTGTTESGLEWTTVTEDFSS